MSRKILLINPPVPDNKVWVREGRCQQWDIWGAPFPPFSLAMISTQLKNPDYETRIIDSGPERKGIQSVISESVAFAPEIVFLATTSPTIQTDLGWFLPKLKEALPRIKVAALGIHVSALPEDTLKRFPLVDATIIGEPEITAREWVEAVVAKKDIHAVRGIAFRDDRGNIRVNPVMGFIENIDDLGFPDWEKIDFRNYLMPIIRQPFSLVSFSRGCPYRCKFCATHAYNGPKLRKRSIASVTAEIHYNLKCGVCDFLFWTEMMTVDRPYLEGFLDALVSEGLHRKIRWVCNSRVDSIDVDIARKMKAAGCWQIAFGFEFGDDAILQLAHKGGNATVEQARIAADLTHKAGIAVDGHFIMGYPGETPETLQKTIDLACSLPLTFAHFYAMVPFPGAPLYNESIEKGWLEAGCWDGLTQDSASLKTATLDPATVDLFIRKAYRFFYLDPRVFFRIYKVPKSFREIVELTKLGFRFYRELRK